MAAADECVVTPAVLGEVNGDDLRILLSLFSDHGEEVVGGAVVDCDYLISKIRPL